MTPDKRVEEILSRFDAELFNDDGWNMRMYQETRAWLRTTLTKHHKDMMSEVVGKIKTKSVIELFPDADVSIPTEELAAQVMYKEAYNDGIREAQTIIKSK